MDVVGYVMICEILLSLLLCQVPIEELHVCVVDMLWMCESR